MKRAMLLIAVITVVAATGLAVTLLVRGSGTSTATPAVRAVRAAKPASPAAAAQAIGAYGSGRPLAAVRAAADQLRPSPTPAVCSKVEAELAASGPPSTYRLEAAALLDPVAADLSASLVTAETQLLASCSATPATAATAAMEATLRDTVAALSARLTEDRATR
ncbi:MAG: hypothetical protein M3256_19745 [Actinomycetota bacterium]|nr:hypothetical protein [Actinomycetota bacterium]